MSKTSSIGQSIRRIDGGEKVAGLARYAADLALPGMVHVRLVLSPYAHARIARIDTKAAAEVPGVGGVFAASDLKLAKIDPTARSKSPLAVDRALFAGHPVVAVAAETAAIAEDAAALIEIEYDVLPAAVDVIEAMGKDAPRVRAAAGTSGEEELAMHGAATGARACRRTFGAKGVGEPPMVGVPAAVASAIADATGQRLTDLLLTGEALAQALRRAR